MEWKLPESDPPQWSAEFHAGRARAPHLEQGDHRPRLLKAAEFVEEAAEFVGPETFSDLGCGDGGLLSLVLGDFEQAWGYDFCPANTAGWVERRVYAETLDVFGDDWEAVAIGNVCAMTEVLEHLRDPHQALAWVRTRARALVCSSPWNERPGSAAAEHAWAWDLSGYQEMIEAARWKIERHETVGPFQVVLAL